MLNLEEATPSDIEEAWRHLWFDWCETAHHSGRRAEVLAEYNRSFDRWLTLVSEFGPMHQRVVP